MTYVIGLLSPFSPRITLAWPAVYAQSLQLGMKPDFLDPQTEVRTVGKREMENQATVTLNRSWVTALNLCAQKLFNVSATFLPGTESGGSS